MTHRTRDLWEGGCHSANLTLMMVMIVFARVDRTLAPPIPNVLIDIVPEASTSEKGAARFSPRGAFSFVMNTAVPGWSIGPFLGNHRLDPCIPCAQLSWTRLDPRRSA